MTCCPDYAEHNAVGSIVNLGLVGVVQILLCPVRFRLPSPALRKAIREGSLVVARTIEDFSKERDRQLDHVLFHLRSTQARSWDVGGRHVESGHRRDEGSDIRWSRECVKAAKVHCSTTGGRGFEEAGCRLQIKNRTWVRLPNSAGTLRLCTQSRVEMAVVRILKNHQRLLGACHLVKGCRTDG